MTAREAEIIELIRKEVKPALGCTEPIAVALAVAKAMEIIEDNCALAPHWRMQDGFTLRIEVSGLIKLHQGKFRVVSGIQTFISEYATDFVHAFKAAYNQSL